MRDIISLIDNDTDFKKFVIGMETKLPPQTKPTEIKYEKHPVSTYPYPNQLPSTHTDPLQALHSGIQIPYGAPGTSSGISAPYQSQVGLPALQSEQSNQSQQQGYGAVIQQPAIIPMQQPGYQPYQQPLPPPPQPNVPELPRTKPVFGESLDTLLERDGSAVPIIVYQCIQAVDLYGLEVEGIYRVPGTKPEVEKIKNIFDNGNGLNYRYSRKKYGGNDTDTDNGVIDSSQVDFRRPEAFFHDVNSVTSVLKQFLRELPEPLLTNALFREFHRASSMFLYRPWAWN